MAEWKSSWNSLAGRLVLSFAAFMVIVTAVFSASPYIFVKETLEDKLAERGPVVDDEEIDGPGRHGFRHADGDSRPTNWPPHATVP